MKKNLKKINTTALAINNSAETKRYQFSRIYDIQEVSV